MLISIFQKFSKGQRGTQGGWVYTLKIFYKAKRNEFILTPILWEFPRGGMEPKKGEPVFRKYSKRIRGTNPYWHPYLKNFQRAEWNPSRVSLQLENILKG